MASIELQSIYKSYNEGPLVIKDVNLQIQQGEFCVFVGPSGCGKSTLLRMIAGLEDLSQGSLKIDGQIMNDVPSADRGVAMVFQSYALFPHMTVYENMSFGMRLAKVDKKIIDQRVKAAAAMLQLDSLLDRKPKALSGGQRQRVAIGRAIVRQPGVFLFDEPLSNLDAALRVQTRFEIAKLHREFGQSSSVYVTHDQVEAMTLADKILLLNTGAATAKYGSIAQHGTPFELYHRPRNQFVAGFIGSPKMNFVSATIATIEPNYVKAKLASGELIKARVMAGALKIGASVTLGIRPEHLSLGNQDQSVIRQVRWQEHLGEITHIYFDGLDDKTAFTMDSACLVKVAGHASLHSGDKVAITLPSQQIHVFDENGQALERSLSNDELKALV